MKLKQLNSFEAACKVEGLNPKKVIPSFSESPKEDRVSLKAYAMLVIIVRAANRIANGGKKWEADYNNSSQLKYEPRWYRGSSGFRYFGFVDWRSDSLVGSRLCFKDYDTMKHVVTRPKFVKIYNEHL